MSHQAGGHLKLGTSNTTVMSLCKVVSEQGTQTCKHTHTSIGPRALCWVPLPSDAAPRGPPCLGQAGSDTSCLGYTHAAWACYAACSFPLLKGPSSPLRPITCHSSPGRHWRLHAHNIYWQSPKPFPEHSLHAIPASSGAALSPRSSPERQAPGDPVGTSAPADGTS